MFWEEAATQNFVNLNSLQTLLSTGQKVSLNEILEDPYTLQELRQGNPNLIQILTTHENLLQLTRNALHPVIDETLPIEQYYNQANLCTEILTVASVNDMIEAFLNNNECMSILGHMLDDPDSLNPVVAIFYTRIFGTIMSKNFLAAMSFMKEYNFLERSCLFLKFGAVADLLECLIRFNSSEEEIRELRQYLTDEKFIPKLISLLDESVEIALQENATDVFVDILRNLREMLAVNDEKTDNLHDVFLDASTINEVLQRMLKTEHNGEKLNAEIRGSLVSNGMNMISALIEHNTSGPSPSQIFEAGEVETGNWNGGGPGEMRSVFDRTQMWLPDREKVAETLAVQKTADMVRMAIEDLQTDAPGDCWLWLLKLLSELADTNHLPTHNALVAGFKEANFKRLFELVRKHPLVHIFHHQLRNIVTYALYSNVGDALSPLVDYFITDCKLFSLLQEGVYPLSDVPKMTMISIRSFHIYLADVFVKAIQVAPHGELIDSLLKNSEEWSGNGEKTIFQGLENYWEKNRPDELRAQSSEQSTARNEPSSSFPEDIESFSRFECTSDIPDFEPVMGAISRLHDFTVSTAVSQESEPINLRDKDPSEEAFEKACNFMPLTNLFPNSALPKTKITLEKKPVENKKLAWPGETSTIASDNSDDVWSGCLAGRLSNGSNSSDDWPSLNDSNGKSDIAKDPFGTAADIAAFQNAIDCLDDSVKSDDQNSTDIWDEGQAELTTTSHWVADFGESSAVNPPPTRDPPVSLNESEA